MSHEIVKELRHSQPDNIEGGPGRSLRHARESLHLTTSDVANHLRLRTQVIDAIEQDNYTALPSLVFAQGYLRSYASLVGISPDEIMQAFRQLNIPQETPSLLPELHREMQKTGNNRSIIRGVTYLIVAVFVILIGVWMYNQSENVHVDLNTVAARPLPNKTITQTPPPPAPQTQLPTTQTVVSLPVPAEKLPAKNQTVLPEAPKIAPIAKKAPPITHSVKKEIEDVKEVKEAASENTEGIELDSTDAISKAKKSHLDE